ncbi:MAG: DPP IV N-terminal domain-containing protein, partial [Bacteroidales bacterium]|nr:DPP IV N-terminal domain-containing protein [Bacteroidales bacterium]
MKKIIAALFVTALSLSGYGQSHNGGDARIRFSDSQIVGGLPAGIINPRPAAAKESGAGHSIPEMVKGWENPTYSPDSTKIAYTLNGNLYSIEVASRRIRQHTFDGSEVILNGYASWVYYEEIFGRRSNYKAFWWSPDSRTIAFYRFDNSKVPMFPIYLADGQHGTLRQTRYPKAGNSNPLVRVGFVSVAGNSPVWADFDFKGDHYFGIPFWDKKGERFIVTWMDRSQDNIVFYSVDPLFGTKRQIYSEHQDTWVDWPEEMLFTDDGFYFVRDYEKWQHIYYLSYEGKNFSYAGDNAPLWRTHLLKVDGKYLFYTACRESSLRQDIYR